MPVSRQESPLPVILNIASGTVRDLQPDVLEKLLRETAEDAGIQLNIMLVEPDAVEPSILDLLGKGEKEIWVGGGDGSVLTAARLLRKTPVVLGVLPFGTFNLLARDLGIPLDPAESVRALIAGKEEWIDVAEVNGQPFLCAAQFGFFPEQAARQEEFHGRQWWRKIIIGASSLVKFYFKYPELRLQLEHQVGGPRHLRTRYLTVSNNVYADAAGLVPERESLKEGRMGVYVSRHRSWLSLLKGVFWKVTGFQYQDRDMLFFELTEFVLKTRKIRSVPATLDGEVMKIRTPMHFKIHARELRVRKAVPVDQVAG